jgi:iron(III) transport system ATP-binding protein
MSGLQVRGLVLRHPGAQVAALDGVEFHAPAGALTALVGPSGCGKTTLLRVLAGLTTPDAGQVLLAGEDLGALPAHLRPMTLVVQNGALFPHLDALGNVLFPLQAAGIAAAAAQARAQAALQLVGLAQHATRRPATLSGGERQRLALARALAPQPAVLLLDEPLSSVDPRLRRALREEIRTLQQRMGLTVVYVTHDQSEALAVSDHVVLMQQGRVVQAGSPQALYQTPRTAFAAAFMGEASLLVGQRDGHGGVWLDGLALASRHPGPAGQVQVAVRPEAWRLRHCSQPGLAGSVARRSYLGKDTEYVVRTPLGPVLVHVPAVGATLDIGAPVSLQLHGPGAWVVEDAPPALGDHSVQADDRHPVLRE